MAQALGHIAAKQAAYLKRCGASKCFRLPIQVYVSNKSQGSGGVKCKFSDWRGSNQDQSLLVFPTTHFGSMTANGHA